MFFVNEKRNKVNWKCLRKIQGRGGSIIICNLVIVFITSAVALINFVDLMLVTCYIVCRSRVIKNENFM